MRQEERESLVLDVRDARDTDKMVLLLVNSGELLATIAPSAAKSRKRFAGALLPGARVRARWTVRREGSMPRLEETHLLGSPPNPDPIERYYVGCHLIEIVRGFAREGAEDPRLYRLLVSCLDALASGSDPDTLARYVEVWVLRLAGLLPDVESCQACGRSTAGQAIALEPERGAFLLEHAPPGSPRLSRAASDWLRRCRNVAPHQIERLSATDADCLSRPLLAMIVAFAERPLTVWPALSRIRRTAGDSR